MFGSHATPPWSYGSPTPNRPFFSGSNQNSEFMFPPPTPKSEEMKLDAILQTLQNQPKAAIEAHELVGKMFGKAGATSFSYPVKSKSIGIFNSNGKTQLARPLVIIGFRVIFICSNPLDAPILDPATCFIFLECPELANTKHSLFFGNLTNIIAAWKANGLPVSQDYQPTFMLNEPTELTSLTFELKVGTLVPIIFGANSNPTVCIEFLYPN